MPRDPAQSASILVVDDQPANTRLLSDVLVHEGYQVTIADCGEAALERLRAGVFDLVLLDVIMPGIDGYAVCRQIRADAQLAALPVVLVTSLDARDERLRGLEAGADDFLTKPFNRPELLARVRSLLRIKRLHDQTQQQADELARWAATLEQRVAEGVAQVERLSRFKRFFSPQLADMIVSGETDDPLRSRRREIAVVYIDLRGFTAFAESAEPEEVMRTLGLYHGAIGRLVNSHQATLERFTGDGMMMFFGDPVPVSDPAGRAVALALAMRLAAAEVSANWRRRGFDLGFSIGVAQGFATVGAIGFEGRIDYGAIGTVTNLASRLCQRAQPGEILLSQRVYSEIEGRFAVEDMGELALNGFARPMRAWRCLGAVAHAEASS